MGLLDRVSILVRANLNDLIERAEDPEKVVKQLILDMNNQLIQVRTHVATAIADERKLQRLWEQNETRANDWQLRAEKAVTAGNDDLAKQCLSRALTYREIADGFRHQHKTQEGQAEKLREAFHQLEAKIQAAEARKDLLIA
ncbi:MAG TPA: PspA/IM30 family protein, partial [Chloroflexota bacterium]